MEDVVRYFVDEALENLESFSRALLLLERDPDAVELVDGLFRNIHTIKGSAGFLAFAGIERISHAGESVLALMRSGERTVSAHLVSVLLSMVDALTGYVADISATQTERERDDSALLAALAAVLQHPAGQGGDHTAAATVSGPAAACPEAGASSPAAVAGDLPRAHGGSSVRVGVETIDNLVRLLGELVTCRNQLRQVAADSGDLQMTRLAHKLALLTGGVRDGVMTARLQRVGNVWQPLPRLARDIAVQGGKVVSIATEGAEIEVDRNVLDAVRDPLVHMVRNAVDHGIETPAERRAAGKDPAGALTLRAEYVEGDVVIEVSDDGRGIDPAVVSARAVELGLLTPDEVSAMAPADLVRLVLRPGFSTSSAVTNVSGRGVGMDVVLTDVEQVGGSLDLASVPGQGTVVRLRVPRSVAIVHVLTVRVGGCRLAIPQTQIAELLRLGPEEACSRVAPSQDGPVLRWRGGLVPLVDLVELLGLAAAEPAERADARDLTVVVARVGAGMVALTVDALLDTEEVVVRAVGRHLEHLHLYAGTVVLPDGAVALLLDVPGVVRASERAPSATAAHLDPGLDDAEPDLGFLTVDVGGERQLAIPVDMVVRLLEADTADIERVGSCEVLPVGDELLPLVRVPAPLAPAGWRPGPRTQVVVVRTTQGRDVGFVVRAVGDLAAVTATSNMEEPLLDAVAVLRSRVTGLLDVRAAAAQVLEQFAAAPQYATAGGR